MAAFGQHCTPEYGMAVGEMTSLGQAMVINNVLQLGHQLLQRTLILFFCVQSPPIRTRKKVSDCGCKSSNCRRFIVVRRETREQEWWKRTKAQEQRFRSGKQ